MSVNYEQYCIIGIELRGDIIEEVISEPVYEEQSRYDSKTGKETHKENVLVKQGETKYVFGNYSSDYLYDLGECLEEVFGLEAVLDQENDVLYLGFRIGEEQNFGRVDLLVDEIEIEDLVSKKEELSEMFPGYAVRLHFAASAR